MGRVLKAVAIHRDSRGARLSASHYPTSLIIAVKTTVDVGIMCSSFAAESPG